jgi:hypothetical protein
MKRRCVMDKPEREKATQQTTETGSQGNGRFWESFPKPAGWSARWDALELDREMQLEDQDAESQTHESTDH